MKQTQRDSHYQGSYNGIGEAMTGAGENRTAASTTPCTAPILHKNVIMSVEIIKLPV